MPSVSFHKFYICAANNPIQAYTAYAAKIRAERHMPVARDLPSSLSATVQVCGCGSQCRWSTAEMRGRLSLSM